MSILEILNQNSIYIILSLAGISIILMIMVIILFSSVNGLKTKYKKMMRGVNGSNLEEVISEYYRKFDNISDQFGKLNGSLSQIDKRIGACIQKTAIKRYKAFENVGSDLSFSLALLDEKNNGLILTGIYGREESTTYAKPVDSGISRYELSVEEKNVLEEAINKKSC
ncbi:MAG: DUF4446 family protein [Bacillota bacterium]|nr:DUF4446 family protein [Bacillota bacterium]